jgi:CHAD domain-containing protein
VVKTTLERELKLEVDGPLDLDGLGGRPLDERTFTSTYHDTADRRLLRHGLTLRRRVEDDTSLWQLKVPQAEGRLELEAEGGSETIAPQLAAVLSGLLREQPLEPVATLVTHRRGRRIDGVDVTLDEVQVLDGSKVVEEFSEIEAELVAGSPTALERLGKRLRKLGARPGDGKPKLARVVEIDQPEQPGSARAVDGLRAFVQEQLDELDRRDPAVRAGNDPEDVHKMRVAVRRLRSVLRTARPMLDQQWVDSLRSELDWLGGMLGEVRDLDVLSEGLHRDAATLNHGDAATAAALLRRLSTNRRDARQKLLAGLEEPRYRRLLDTLESATTSLPATRDDLTTADLATKEFKKLGKRGALTDSMTSAALHKRRIRIKRARYAAELAEPTVGAKAQRFIDAAKGLQDTLGEHQDAVVASRRLRVLAQQADSRSAALVAGRLIERQEAHMREARADLASAWKRLRRLGKRAWV